MRDLTPERQGSETVQKLSPAMCYLAFARICCDMNQCRAYACSEGDANALKAALFHGALGVHC